MTIETDNVLSRIMEMRLANGKMDATEVRQLLVSIGIEEGRLVEMRRQVERACTHFDEKGKKTTNPTGGGMAQCWVCHGEID
jgi:hypothetical protein